MSLRLEIKKKMLERSPRVKALDFHSQNSWILLGLYSGILALHDYSTNTCIRTLQCSTHPIRAVRFITSKQWMVGGSDDFMIRVFNYNTMEKVKGFEAHNDFIRFIIVHPNQPYMISSSDDATIKIWNYQQDFALVRTLTQHTHFVFGLCFNPRDLTKFASGSMDKTIKIWNLTTEGKANLTLTGHKAAVNTIDFYRGDKPHLASGSDDRTIKIWDYQTRQCLNTIQAHALTVTSVFFHPELPLLISTGQDGKVHVFHSSSMTILNTLQYNLQRAWTGDVSKENPNILAFGYDEGTVVIKIGSDQPVVSICNGKILWTKSMQIYTGNLKAINLQQSPSGQKIRVNSKQIGVTDIYPTYLKHSPNGHHFALCNQKQFMVMKTASFKSTILGNGTNLVWFNDTDFAVCENDIVNMYHNFQFSSALKLTFLPQKLFEGPLLGVASPDKLIFYDWDSLSNPVNQLDHNAQKVWWNQNGTLLSIATPDKLVQYTFNKSNNGFTQLLIVGDKITSGIWVDKIFFFMNQSGKIFFSILGKSYFYANSDRKQFILGIVQQQNRLYLFDRNNSVYSIHINFEVLKQVALFIEGKRNQLPEIPQDLRDKIAKCLHSFNLLKQAYKIVQNLDHKFDLALQLGLVREGIEYINKAYKIASSSHSNDKIKLIGDISLKKGQIQLAIQCYEKVNDLNSLLLIYSTLSLPAKLTQLGEKAQKLTKMNIAYMCYYLTNNTNKCIDVLLKSKRFSEAALFSRSYCSARISQCVSLWKRSLTDKVIAQKISDPNEQDNEQQQQDEAEQQSQEIQSEA